MNILQNTILNLDEKLKELKLLNSAKKNNLSSRTEQMNNTLHIQNKKKQKTPFLVSWGHAFGYS